MTLYFIIFTTSTFCLLPRGRIPFPTFPGFRLHCYVCDKFCGRKSSTADEKYAGSEWRVDPNGSVILIRGFSTSTSTLEAQRDASEMPMAVVSDPKVTFETGDFAVMNQNMDTAKVNDLDSVSPRDNETALKTVERSDSDAAEGEIMLLKKDSVSPGDNETALKTVEHSDSGAPEGEIMLLKKTSSDRKTFRQVALSPLFLTDLLWISVQRLRSWIFVGMFNPWITRLACGDKALGKFIVSLC